MMSHFSIAVLVVNRVGFDQRSFFPDVADALRKATDTDLIDRFGNGNRTEIVYVFENSILL